MGTQTILAFAAGLLIGGAGGAYAMRLVYGDAPARVDVGAPQNELRLRCPECRACPPPVDCGELGLVPEAVPSTPLSPREVLPPESGGLPGLPPLALKRASEAVRTAVAPCVAQAEELDAHGVLLLDITVTATGGQGFVRTLEAGGRTGAPGPVEPCIIDRAWSARFAWDGDDGVQRLKLPIQVAP